MTTNQTIDGVPRDLLFTLTKYIDDGLGMTPWEKGIVGELHALLDAHDALHGQPADATHYYPKVLSSRKWRKQIEGAWHEWCGGKWLPLDHAMVDDYVPAALLDAPVYPQIKLVRAHKHTCACVTGDTGVCDCGAVVDGVPVPAAQPQGEPVAWRVTGRGGLTVTPQYPKWAVGERGLTITPLYAEQPAPVAVVLPERRKPTCTGSISDFTTFEEARGWNACLDEVTRLNPSL